MLCVVAFGWDGRGQGLLGEGDCADGVWGVEDLGTCSGFSSWKEEWK